MSSPNGASPAFAPVLAALATMQSNADRSRKHEAHQYLEAFQKDSDAWTTTFAMLQSTDTAMEAKMFAATTLKGKIVYDFHQLPQESHAQLRDSLLSLLRTYSKGPKPIRTQLSVALANVAIQMLSWKDVLPYIVSTLGTNPDSVACFLEFLRVLPEELSPGRKINLNDDELYDRTAELLQQNGPQILTLLVQYAQSSAAAAKDAQLMECLTSWIREIPLEDVLRSLLLKIVVNALQTDDYVESAADCMRALIREADPDEAPQCVQLLYPELLAQRPRLTQIVADGDSDVFQGLTRIFAEAGERWTVLIARDPANYGPLAECILECAANDQDRDAIPDTFKFWEDLKQLLTLERYANSRLQYVEIYAKLVDIMLSHLEYPRADSKSSTDLFDGDRVAEEKFRTFRHSMGDVLKDCTEVIGVTECLKKIYGQIQQWVSAHGAQARQDDIPDWQKLEAALFGMRAMGRMVSDDESIMLPQLIPLLVQIPDHEKVRFQAVMALGRYTAWSAKHPEMLEPQLGFIITSFEHRSKQVQEAAALSLRWFCQDCAELLKDHISQLQQFYESVLDKLQNTSRDEVTEGISAVIARLPPQEVYAHFKASCDPVMKRIVHLAQTANDKESKIVVADHIRLVKIFIEAIRPRVEPLEANPAVIYCQEIFPVLSAIAERFHESGAILETVCGTWRQMVTSYRTAISPLLPDLAAKLTAGFAASRQGCYLWASGLIIREFTAEAPNVDAQTLQAVFAFFEQQATNFLRVLNDVKPEELDDVIEDFFRLSIDALLYHPHQYIASPLLPSILLAACASLSLLKQEPLMAILHFLRDLLAYATPDPPSSQHSQETGLLVSENPQEVQQAVKNQLDAMGESLTQRVLTGMMYTFPADCFPDASGVLLALFQITPAQTAGWVEGTVKMLPPESMSRQEQERLFSNIGQRVQSGEIRKIRAILQDFTNSYRRRNVAPRDGLGLLEPDRFRFNG